MGLKAFLLIVLAIFLVITSEVAARKLVQRSITSSENGIEGGGILPETLGVGVLPEVGGPSGVLGGLLPNGRELISGLPIVGGLLPGVGGPSGVGGGLLGGLIPGLPIVGGLLPGVGGPSGVGGGLLPNVGGLLPGVGGPSGVGGGLLGDLIPGLPIIGGLLGGSLQNTGGLP